MSFYRNRCNGQSGVQMGEQVRGCWAEPPVIPQNVISGAGMELVMAPNCVWLAYPPADATTDIAL